MKRFLFGVTIVCGGALLGGCPVYSNDRYCSGSGCYDCPAGTTPANGTCVQWSCSTSQDCDSGYVCDTSSYTCVPAGGCGQGCPAGYVCKLSGGVAQCAPSGGAADAGAAADASRSDAALDAHPAMDGASAVDAPATSDTGVMPVDAGTDATDAADATPPALPCNSNAECGQDGGKCIDGHCAAQSALCSDTTQCVVAGEACVDGVCEVHCSASSPCPAGYACDFNLGLCDLNADPCSGSGRSTCLGGSVCVEGRCVSPCATSDSGSACPGGQVCVNGGCIPDEAARFACKNDGQSGLLANECGAAEVCLHHGCYAECDPEASACADPATSCKQVSVTAGTYAVCATATNLGSDCDPAAGKYCPTGVCVDGYCR